MTASMRGKADAKIKQTLRSLRALRDIFKIDMLLKSGNEQFKQPMKANAKVELVLSLKAFYKR